MSRAHRPKGNSRQTCISVGVGYAFKGYKEAFIINAALNITFRGVARILLKLKGGAES